MVNVNYDLNDLQSRIQIDRFQLNHQIMKNLSISTQYILQERFDCEIKIRKKYIYIYIYICIFIRRKKKIIDDFSTLYISE